MRVTDAGSRYAVTIPLVRELSETERDSLTAALDTAAFEHPAGVERDEPISPESVTVTDDEARVIATLALSDDHGPGDLAGAVYRTVGAWVSGRQPYDEPTRAGGETTVASLDAAAFPVDRDPASETHTAVLLAPERPLTDDEQAMLSAGLSDAAVVTPAGVALFDAADHVVADPRGVLQLVRQAITQHAPTDAPIRELDTWAQIEAGTLASVDDAGREAVRERLNALGPQTTGETEPEEVVADV